jgi:hypothetical protein
LAALATAVNGSDASVIRMRRRASDKAVSKARSRARG